MKKKNRHKTELTEQYRLMNKSCNVIKKTIATLSKLLFKSVNTFSSKISRQLNIKILLTTLNDVHVLSIK